MRQKRVMPATPPTPSNNGSRSFRECERDGRSALPTRADQTRGPGVGSGRCPRPVKRVRCVLYGPARRGRPRAITMKPDVVERSGMQHDLVYIGTQPSWLRAGSNAAREQYAGRHPTHASQERDISLGHVHFDPVHHDVVWRRVRRREKNVLRRVARGQVGRRCLVEQRADGAHGSAVDAEEGVIGDLAATSREAEERRADGRTGLEHALRKVLQDQFHGPQLCRVASHGSPANALGSNASELLTQ